MSSNSGQKRSHLEEDVPAKRSKLDVQSTSSRIGFVQVCIFVLCLVPFLRGSSITGIFCLNSLVDDREGRIYSLTRGVLEAVKLAGKYRMAVMSGEGRTAVWKTILSSHGGTPKLILHHKRLAWRLVSHAQVEANLLSLLSSIFKFSSSYFEFNKGYYKLAVS